jgi:hypothetical protein
MNLNTRIDWTMFLLSSVFWPQKFCWMDTFPLRWKPKMPIPVHDENSSYLALSTTQIRGNAAACSLAFFASFENPLGLLDMSQKHMNLTHKLELSTRRTYAPDPSSAPCHSQNTKSRRICSAWRELWKNDMTKLAGFAGVKSHVTKSP